MNNKGRYSNTSDIKIIRLRINILIMFNNYRSKEWVRNKWLRKKQIQYLEIKSIIIYIYKSMSYLNIILDIAYKVTGRETKDIIWKNNTKRQRIWEHEREVKKHRG